MAVSGIHDDDDDIGTLHACAWPWPWPWRQTAF